MKRLYLVIGTLVLFLAATATMGFGADWILESKSGKLPADLEATVLAAGGTLVKTLDEVGIAVADFATREEAEAMEAHGFTVMPDVSPRNDGAAVIVTCDEVEEVRVELMSGQRGGEIG